MVDVPIWCIVDPRPPLFPVRSLCGRGVDSRDGSFDGPDDWLLRRDDAEATTCSACAAELADEAADHVRAVGFRR